MARTLSSQAVYHSLTGVFRLDDTATTGAVDANAAKGASSFDVGTGEGASFPADSIIRIGSNGSTAVIAVVKSVAIDTLTLMYPLSRAILATEVVTLLSKTDLGATDENGVNQESTQGQTAIVAGTQKKTYLYINQNLEEVFTWALRDFDQENILASLGIDDTSVVHLGTDGVVLPLDDVVSVSYQPWCFEGVLEGGTLVTGFLFSAKVTSANQTMQFVEGQATIIPFTLGSNGDRAFMFE